MVAVKRLAMQHPTPLSFLLFALAAAVAVLISGALRSEAVQSPVISLDMVPAGNTYDDATNTMTVGTIDNCLASAAANTSTHTHSAQIVIQNVEDLIAWQVRLNYVGDRFRPNTVNFTPFVDNNTGQNISFNNLPIEAATSVHRGLVTAENIPAAAPGPQTAGLGATYIGSQDFAVSPDTPAKTAPDDTSYNAPTGGVLAAVTLQVVGDESGQTLNMDLDDEFPNGPGSAVAIFDGFGIVEIRLAESSLGDGFHAEGAAGCVVPPPPPSPANDNFGDRTVITEVPFTDGPFSTAGATVETGEPLPCDGLGKTVWYEFTPSSNVFLTAGTFGSDFPARVNVYDSDPFLPSTPVFGCLGVLDLNLTGGTTYYFQVGGFRGASGNVIFELSEPTPPPTPTPTATQPPGQAPTISLDMDPTGNTYDDATNTMTVGTIDNCLTSAIADTTTHTHSVHLIVQNVEDMVAWQARFNYFGDQMRVAGFDATPFLDSNTAAEVGFLNLPIDAALGDHRGVIPLSDIPPAPADGSNTPQTALFGSVYLGTPDFAVSPDTPPKITPDDTSYSAPDGGVLASVSLEVLGDESGQPSLFMNLDDGFPNLPPSSIAIFDGLGVQTIVLSANQLGDGYHGEGAACAPLDCVTKECPSPPAPSNDNFADATVVPDIPYSASQSTIGATLQPFEPTGSCGGIAGTVWYSFTPLQDGQLQATITGSDFVPIVAAYTGDALPGLTLIACGGSSFNGEFMAHAGETVYFQAGGPIAGLTGNIMFNLQEVVPPPPPANDNFAAATVITPLPSSENAITEGATNEPSEPSPCAGIGNAVWYTFTPSLDGALEANTFGSNFDTALAVYRGTSLDNLIFVDCNDNAVGLPGIFLQSRVRFLAHAGETIYFQAGGFFGLRGNLVFNLLEFNAPPNDDFPGSVIESLPFTATQNTSTATFESGEPGACAPVGATVWFAFTPSEDMNIAADTFGSDFDTVLAAYRGTSLFTLIPVACNDQFQGNQSKITFSATAGTTYYFQVGGFFGQTGNLVFSVDVGPPPLEVAVSIAPNGSVTPQDGTATVHGSVTCSKPAFVELSGELSQQAGRATISGFFFIFLPCQGETPWDAEVEGENGPFAGGRAGVSVEAFAFAQEEPESDFAEASGTVLLKGTRPPPPARCPRTGNDGFELGVVDSNAIPCWTVVDQEGGSGSWCNQTATVPPQGDCPGSSAPVAAPPEGSQAAMTNQGGPGSHVLYRCGVLRSGQISFQLQINNQAFSFVSPPSLDFEVFPNQQFRVDLLTAAGVAADPFTVAPADVLLNLYQTLPGDPPISGYGALTADASAYVGQEVCLRFAEVDNLSNFNVGVDDVSIDLRSRP